MVVCTLHPCLTRHGGGEPQPPTLSTWDMHRSRGRPTPLRAIGAACPCACRSSATPTRSRRRPAAHFAASTLGRPRGSRLLCALPQRAAPGRPSRPPQPPWPDRAGPPACRCSETTPFAAWRHAGPGCLLGKIGQASWRFLGICMLFQIRFRVSALKTAAAAAKHLCRTASHMICSRVPVVSGVFRLNEHTYKSIHATNHRSCNKLRQPVSLLCTDRSVRHSGGTAVHSLHPHARVRTSRSSTWHPDGLFSTPCRERTRCLCEPYSPAEFSNLASVVVGLFL